MLAREKRQDNAGIQTTRVIVDVHREQARSYRYEVAMAFDLDLPHRPTCPIAIELVSV